jgi:hypothetical protein
VGKELRGGEPGQVVSRGEELLLLNKIEGGEQDLHRWRSVFAGEKNFFLSSANFVWTCL